MAPVSTIDTAELTRLHGQGMNDVQIGQALGRNRTTIASARARLGLPSQDKSELARAAGKLGGRPAHKSGRGIVVAHKPTNTRPLNEYYRLARLARASAWQRVHSPGVALYTPTDTTEETKQNG